MTTTAQRLTALRAELARLGVTGVAVPLTDEHMSEYVGHYAKRLEWLTGFTGSAGAAVVLDRAAAIFIDGRYTLQVKDQVPEELFAHVKVPDTSIQAWLKAHARSGDVIAYDPWFHTKAWVASTREALASVGAELRAVSPHPIDAIWTDRPGVPLDPIQTHAASFAGKDLDSKRADIAAAIAEAGADAAVIAALDSIAWLFNVRGTDVDRTPVPRAFTLMRADGSATLFTEGAKVTEALRRHLGNHVTIEERSRFPAALAELGAAKAKVLCDTDFTVAAVFEALEAAGASVIEGRDPCVLPKARKNPVEVQGTRTAHERDGAAVTRFLHWLAGAAPAGEVDELTAVDRLLDFRKQTGQLKDTSFDSIAGAGPNGAIVHYRSTPATNRPLKVGELFLIDSGGQYLDGTTDITRTIAVGAAGAEERARFTRVLKGHIAIATARFPIGTAGQALDSLARLSLWQAGLDYDHGTGHGVGSYLAVHEGPQRIAKWGSAVPLEPGMILSNEPGYYKTGAYGIRIENLVLVQEDQRDDDERDMLAFETLTLAPIDRALIEPSLLSADELAWLNAYHARVAQTLAPLLPEDSRAWMLEQTRAL
jgi:Xaa-Pro aminopeptidase